VLAVARGFLRPVDGGDTFLRNVGSYKSHIPEDGILHKGNAVCRKKAVYCEKRQALCGRNESSDGV
jgi:hypothetical protein